MLVLCVAGVTYLVLHFTFSLPAKPGDQSTSLFVIAEQEGFRSVSKRLEQQGFIRYSWVINLIAKLKRKDTQVMAGEYEISPGMTQEEILERFVSGKMLLRKITVREGASIWEIGKLLQDAGIVTKASFEASLTDPKLLEEAKITGPSFEGYLFPETYQFPKDTPIKKIIWTMLSEFNKKWAPEFDARAQFLGMNKSQLLTLASIIEKESGNSEDQPIIASVFHNRLKKEMKLQSDPTVIYGIPNFNGNITKNDLLAPTPFNTYVIAGLPPGPIANPGITAIKATLFPAETQYLFFVADNRGGHVFSEKLEDHNRAVSEFQKGK